MMGLRGSSTHRRKRKSLAIVPVGIDLAKNVFALHGVNDSGVVQLRQPKLVTPYRTSGKRGKNDAADAAAICEAVTRPTMRFVPVKSVEQQSRLMVHRAAMKESVFPTAA